MRVLHGIASLDPNWGGPPAVVIRIAAAQAARGHHAAVLTYSQYHGGDSPERVRKAIAQVPGIEKVEIINLDPADRAERLLARKASRAMPALLSRFDVLHMHGVWEPFIVAATAAAYKRRIPYVIRPAGMLDSWCLKQQALKKQVALALFHRRMLRRAAFIHALNRDEARMIELLGLPTPIQVIPNGVFLAELEPLPPRGTFYKRHPELQGRPYVLFLSRLHYKKGLDYLAEAFAMLAARRPEAQLVVAGPDDGYRAEFERLVAARNLGDRVHMVGGLYGTDKLPAIVDAACFCLPSRQEGFSVAITESLACGTPAVVSADCHFPEVEEVGAGFVVPLEPAKIADAMERIITDAPLRQKMSEAARSLVRERFTWPAIAERCIQEYTRAGARAG